MDETLVEYIKETSGAGFDDQQIMAQLLKSGWGQQEITEAFVAAGRKAPLGTPPPITSSPPPSLPPQGGGNTIQGEEESWLSRHKGTLVTIVAVIILLPLVAYGGLWAYQKYFAAEKDTTTSSPPAPSNATGSPGEENALMKTRDEQRLQDIATLQTALATYYETKRFYPKSLSDLATENVIVAAPTDPQPGKLYLYKALDDPALHYSLSFVLETRMGPLAAGLQVVTDESRLPAAAIQNQEDVVQGAATAIATERLLITDLSALPFYPQEEVHLDIAATADAEFVSIFLVMNSLELVDQSPPLGFHFTAPKEPGTYPVQIFAFDKKGQGYLQKTALHVRSQ